MQAFPWLIVQSNNRRNGPWQFGGRTVRAVPLLRGPVRNGQWRPAVQLNR